MEQRKKILLILGFLFAGLLSLWGTIGVWTAAKVVPESAGKTVRAGSDVKSDAPRAGFETKTEKEADDEDLFPEEEANRQYATGQNKRNKPLGDPFRIQKGTLPAAGKSEPGHAQGAVSSLPKLSGIVILGEDRRCILQTGDITQTVRVGEGVGGWTVTEIREKEVVLQGAFGVQSLTL